MRILIANLILYTPEKGVIPKVKSIKDTMIYDLCLAFTKAGHQVTLYAADRYRPIEKEDYEFEIVWGTCKCEKLFKPTALPFTPDLYSYMKKHEKEYDLVISSEVFSLASLMLTRVVNRKLIVWHELAKHNRMMHQIPSKVWYHVIARLFFKNTKVIARSAHARQFIAKFCPGTLDVVIDHGVNLSLFKERREKENHFVVCSQLIPRKQIEGIIDRFEDFLAKYQRDFKLYIIGDGELRNELEAHALKLRLKEKVIFTGHLSHEEMLPYLASAKGLLVNTRQDNNMVSIVESIAVGTPVLTTPVPYNAEYIKKYRLGIVERGWVSSAMEELVRDNAKYVNNCLKYREKLSTEYRVKQFLEAVKKDV